jgi:hypothetical protein
MAAREATCAASRLSTCCTWLVAADGAGALDLLNARAAGASVVVIDSERARGAVQGAASARAPGNADFRDRSRTQRVQGWIGNMAVATGVSLLQVGALMAAALSLLVLAGWAILITAAAIRVFTRSAVN